MAAVTQLNVELGIPSAFSESDYINLWGDNVRYDSGGVNYTTKHFTAGTQVHYSQENPTFQALSAREAKLAWKIDKIIYNIAWAAGDASNLFLAWDASYLQWAPVTGAYLASKFTLQQVSNVDPSPATYSILRYSGSWQARTLMQLAGEGSGSTGGLRVEDLRGMAGSLAANCVIKRNSSNLAWEYVAPSSLTTHAVVSASHSDVAVVAPDRMGSLLKYNTVISQWKAYRDAAADMDIYIAQYTNLKTAIETAISDGFSLLVFKGITYTYAPGVLTAINITSNVTLVGCSSTSLVFTNSYFNLSASVSFRATNFTYQNNSSYGMVYANAAGVSVDISRVKFTGATTRAVFNSPGTAPAISRISISECEASGVGPMCELTFTGSPVIDIHDNTWQSTGTFYIDSATIGSIFIRSNLITCTTLRLLSASYAVVNSNNITCSELSIGNLTSLKIISNILSIGKLNVTNFCHNTTFESNSFIDINLGSGASDPVYGVVLNTTNYKASNIKWIDNSTNLISDNQRNPLFICDDVPSPVKSNLINIISIARNCEDSFVYAIPDTITNIRNSSNIYPIVCHAGYNYITGKAGADAVYQGTQNNPDFSSTYLHNIYVSSALSTVSGFNFYQRSRGRATFTYKFIFTYAIYPTDISQLVLSVAIDDSALGVGALLRLTYPSTYLMGLSKQLYVGGSFSEYAAIFSGSFSVDYVRNYPIVFFAGLVNSVANDITLDGPNSFISVEGL